MVKQITDINIINYFLNQFDVEFSDNPFEKYFCYEKRDIQGFICISEIYERIELNYIFVVDKYKNQGIGSQLMEFLIDYSIKNNIDNISLEVDAKNYIAIKLYEKYHFKRVALRKNYYGDNDGYLMIRNIGG